MVSYHRANTAITVFYSVLGSLSERCFLTSATQNSSSHLNAASFGFVNERRVSPVSHTARPPPRVRFPTHKQQDCQDSRDSLDTVLSETAVTV